MLRQRLSQKMIQKLSPQQIQLMKLLQVPTASLEQRIKEELEGNPALEEGVDNEKEESAETETEERIDSDEDDFDISDYLTDEDDWSTSYGTPRDRNEEEKTIPIAVQDSFQERLQRQLGLVDLSDHERMIAQQLIGSIDEDGYLRRDLEDIVDDLAFGQNIETDIEELERVLQVIHRFEPAGIGARDLRECLLLQLERKPVSEQRDAAILILQDHFEEFTKKHFDKLQKQIKLNDEQIKMAVDEILKLNPKPGGSQAGGQKPNQYIVPDFTIVNNNGELEILLNSRNAPDLHVSEGFKDMLKAYKRGPKKDKKQKEALLFIKQKIDSAKWFIDAIKQRQQTLYNSMHAIMDHQYDFFLTGDETQLNPMILKDIAEVTGLDISTISRVANSKYVSTEFGTMPLKYFFSESLTTDSGEEVSTREVKRILSDIIEAEDKHKPLSDQKLTDMLKDKSYNIARRTVAKYREQLGIPVARLRKEL